MNTTVIEQLISQYWNHNQTLDEFQKSFVDVMGYSLDEDLCRKELSKASEEEDSEMIDIFMLLGFIIGFSQKSLPVLNDLLVKPCHHQHEDIAMLFSDFKDPVTVSSLYTASLMELDYLDYDDTYQLARKCIKALYRIGSEEAQKKLVLLSASPNQVISSYASKELSKLRKNCF